ncbi:hypothetical protein NE237_025280 [Protea cynaroides]|uniref:AAA+ ATPase domain-containing protein n=1 Tax=Protea cynaroides TaxID=273540 RepID=A0A9Q0H2U7_9MAGN|nr:hypothetical protein NE237_025280 [Protea cynaroides]
MARFRQIHQSDSNIYSDLEFSRIVRHWWKAIELDVFENGITNLVINYLRNSRDNVNGLQTSLQNLTARKNDEQSTLRAADNAGQVETAAARNWLHAVSEIEREADDIQEEYNQGTCARGWCVNCWSRYKVSRRSVNLKAKADLKLTEEFPVARQPSPEPVIEMEDVPTQNQPSIRRILQQLIDRIYDPQSGIIGVYGMGGVDLSNATEDGSREKLSEALRKKKFLLILDDVWQQLELMKVGIPHPIRSHKGSEIMLTTRSQDVCTDMHADFTMKVKPLSREEAWTLFVEDVGQHVIVNDSIKYFAEKIVERCEGLPLAIVTVAHAMANRHGVGEWANAEREMKESIQDIRDIIDTYLIAPLVQQINYLRNSRDNVNDLQTSVRNLTSRRNDEQSALRAAENDGQVLTDAAINWFNAVSVIKRKADEMQEEYNQGTSWGMSTKRYKVSKRFVNLKTEADLRLTEQFPVARQPSPEPVIEMEEEPTQNQPSTQTNLQQLIDHIYDPHSRIIGVYGMGGVGKTTLIGKVNNHFKENPIFDTVIMVTVSATPNIKDIQSRISKRLGLDLSEDTEDFAIEKMLNALRKKKFLLILDDVWQQLELKNVGIPHPIRSHKGSKIMLTTRSQDVCTDMHADFTMKVKPLSREEAWTLFVENVGQHVIVNDSIKDFAEKIVERCEGLPLAIVTVAHAMANRHGVGEWANAEREMKESIQDIRGMENKVLTLLKFSFDRLDNDLLKSLFLYCACFPEDHNITKDEIFIFCVGEGLVYKCGSLIAARNKGEALIGSLKVACTLEDGEDDEGGSVRMHDMMRELALWITSPMSDSSTKFLIRTDESIVEAPQANEWAREDFYTLAPHHKIVFLNSRLLLYMTAID